MMRSSLIAMMAYLLIFGALTLLSLYGVLKGVRIVDLGFSAQVSNILILILSVLGLFKSLWHIHRL